MEGKPMGTGGRSLARRHNSALQLLLLLCCLLSCVCAQRRKGKRAGAGSGGAEADESASLFFLLAILTCIIAPWTLIVVWSLLTPGRKEIKQIFPERTEDGCRVRQCQTQAMSSKREAQVQKLRLRRRMFTSGFIFRCVVLMLLWCWLLYIAVQVRKVLATSALYQNFDPIEILGVSRSSKASEVKKAYHRLSLKYHPDKNKAKDAAEKFLIIKKAYDALTDPIAKRNFERYGNPDGPTRIELKVALPSISKEKQSLVLILFVLLFIIGVPVTMLCFMGGSSGSVCPNGVLRTTMEALVQDKRVTAGLDVCTVRDLLLQSYESTSCLPRDDPEEKQTLENMSKELGTLVKNKGNNKASADSAVPKAAVLLLVHMHRRHDLLSAALASDLDELLPKWRAIAMAIVELAAAKTGSSDAVLAALGFHRCLLQALSPEAPSQLLQVPHFDAERVKLWKKGPRKTAGLSSFLDMSAELGSSLEPLGLQEQQVADIQEFATAAPRLVIREAKVVVVGEEGICAGDIATVLIDLERLNLREGEATGAVHAPFFPDAAVPEAWWVFFSLPGKSAPMLCSRCVGSGRQQSLETLKFKVRMTGKFRCTLRVLSEAYEGLDLEQQVVFEAKVPPEPAEDDDEEEDGNNEDDEDEDEDDGE